MAVTEDRDLEDSVTVSFRTTERMRRKIGMRAEQLGLDKSTYVLSLIDEDLADANIPELD